MSLSRVWVCTSKNSKLNRIYLIQTDADARQDIYDNFFKDAEEKAKEDSLLEKLNGNALIEDLPYFILIDEIQEESYLYPIKEKVEEIKADERESKKILTFSKNPLNIGGITSFEENEGIKFIIAQAEDAYYFLQVTNNSIIKNKLVWSFPEINSNSTLLEVPKGIQIPSAITAKFETNTNKLYVYDVNRFEAMLTLNENQKLKSSAVLNNFINGEYRIGEESYKFKGLENENVQQKLKMSKRAIRRLAKYQPPLENYSISRIRQAVEKLDEDLRVVFDEENKEILVNENSAKTFVGIIHNVIVQRLISGEVEIVI